MSPDAALALCRACHDLATMVAWGATAFLATLVPATVAAYAGRRTHAAIVVAILVAVGTTVAALPVEAGFVGDGWADAVDPATVRAVLLETSVGRAWQVQAVAAVLLAFCPVLPRRVRTGATAAASGLLLSGLALAGHAAMHAGWLGVAHRLNHALHVLAAGAWLGALVPFLPLMRALDDPALRREAATALRRFSVAGHVAVAAVIATGTVNTGLVLGRWPTDWSSPYQALLSLKIAAVTVMVLLALVNRYVLVPRLPLDPAHAAHALRRNALAALGLGAAAVTCVGVFGLIEPG